MELILLNKQLKKELSILFPLKTLKILKIELLKLKVKLTS